MTHTILSLDLGSTLGWAFSVDGVVERSGSITLAHKDAHPGSKLERFLEFLHEHKDVDEILYEFVPRFVSAGWAVTYGSLLGQVMLFCKVHGIRYGTLKPSEIKKVFTGKGNADKKAVCAICHKMGWKRGKPGSDIDNDEADAIALLCSTLMRRGQQVKLGDDITVG
jgi:Holliday junction resolvasome RuvABC endonuclease subunit